MLQTNFRFASPDVIARATVSPTEPNRLRPATAEEQKMIAESLTRLLSHFGKICDNVHFTAHDGRALGLARVREDAKFITISLNLPELLKLPNLGDNFSAEKRIDWMLSHELTHLADRNAAVNKKLDSTYLSSKLADFHPGGELLNEISDAQGKSRLFNWTYRYPLSLPFDNPIEKTGTNTRAKEVFAQTIALYINQPEAMHAHLPKSHAFARGFAQEMARLPCLIGSSREQSADNLRSDAARSTPSGREQLSANGSTGLPRVVRGISGEVDARLSAAQSGSLTAKPDPRLLVENAARSGSGLTLEQACTAINSARRGVDFQCEVKQASGSYEKIRLTPKEVQELATPPIRAAQESAEQKLCIALQNHRTEKLPAGLGITEKQASAAP